MDKEFLLEAGEIIVINSDVVHSEQSPNTNNIVVLQIDNNFLRQYTLYEYGEKWQFTAQPFTYVKTSIFNELRTDKFISNVQNNLQKMSLLFKLLLDLSTKRREQISSKFSMSNKDIEQMSKIIDFINRNFTQGILLKDVAKSLGYSEGYFSRLFKKNMGMTYYKYLNIIRLSAAYSDMKYTNKSLVEIARDYGFKDYRNFYNTFLNNYRMSPKEYRKLIIDRS